MQNTYFFTGFPGFIAVRLIKRLMQENAQARFPTSSATSTSAEEALDYFQCASRYDCSQAIADLHGSGITCPQFDDYVGAAVRYFQVHRNDSDKVIIVH